MPWCENMSNCVPTWPSSVMTSSSFELRLLRAERAVGALGVEVEAARAEERHVAGQHAAELDDLAGADQLRRPRHARRRDVVGGAALVGRAPLRRAALLRRRRRPRLRRRRGHAGEQASRHQRCTVIAPPLRSARSCTCAPALLRFLALLRFADLAPLRPCASSCPASRSRRSESAARQSGARTPR